MEDESGDLYVASSTRSGIHAVLKAKIINYIHDTDVIMTSQMNLRMRHMFVYPTTPIFGLYD